MECTWNRLGANVLMRFPAGSKHGGSKLPALHKKPLQQLIGFAEEGVWQPYHGNLLVRVRGRTATKSADPVLVADPK